MRHPAYSTLFTVITLGLVSSACSMLGTYAGSASSMMSQPGVAATGAPTTPSSPATSSPATAAATPEAETATAPATVSVTLVNACSDTVKVFFGDKPKFGSGRYSSLSSNSRTNQTFKPGDQLWIVDDGQNGVANAKIEASTREIEVASGCKTLRAR
jgi:hypothetical protein